MIDLERELKEKSTESKITRFGSGFVEKSMSELERNFRTRRVRNPKLKTKLTKSTILNYKFNDIKLKIRRTTHDLTRDSDQNIPINHRIQGFSLCNFEDDLLCSRGEVSLFNR